MRGYFGIATVLMVGILAGPFLFTLAGDAQVHLAIAENFTNGRPFQYNPDGQLVVASTSPFWTIILILFYFVAGNLAPLLLKLCVLLLWLGTGYLLHRVAGKWWRLSGLPHYAVTILWLAHTTVVANALSGLENVLSAFQLLTLYILTISYRGRLTTGRSLLLGGLIGWMFLTRPDGGLFGLVVLALFMAQAILSTRQQVFPPRLAALAAQTSLMALSALIVLLPWTFYQYAYTGNFVTDSSLARLYTGRQTAIPLLPPYLYLHPKAVISLATAFAPLSLGFLVLAGDWWRRLRHHGHSLAETREFAQTTAMILVVSGIFFYTFVVGAEAFGRYFLPIYPFLFLTGVTGLKRANEWLREKRAATAQLFAVLIMLFLLVGSSVDYYRRVFTGRFTTESVLNVIYGPAHRRYFAYNLGSIIDAPQQRMQHTDEVLRLLQAPAADTVSFAVTEVQLRYFVDTRLEIVSLDGRTSATILDYFDVTTGVPDFERYFIDERPDYVHVNQWCEVGGWLTRLPISRMKENLVCAWQKQVEQMQPGQSFTWQGHQLTLVAPEIVRIDWRGTAGH